MFKEDQAQLWLHQYKEMMQTLQCVYSEFEKEENVYRPKQFKPKEVF